MRCKTCPILLAKDEFASHATSQWYKVKGSASCKSSNVIYLIGCKRYGHKYVRETGQPLHCRMNGHWSDITHQRTKESPVAMCFNNVAHSVGDMVVMVIDQSYSLDPTLRKLKESKWIRDLRTTFLQGMNLRVNSLWIYFPPETSGHSGLSRLYHQWQDVITGNHCIYTCIYRERHLSKFKYMIMIGNVPDDGLFGPKYESIIIMKFKLIFQ